MSDPDLAGQKVRVRRFNEADITDDYLSWLNDLRTTRFSNQRFAQHDRASSERYLASFANSFDYFLSVRDLADDRAIGTMTAYFQPHHRTVDVGILIGDPATWGKGYGQDAWRLVIDWLLARDDVRKVTAGTLACNTGMLRLMELGGLSFEGARVAQELVDGEAMDIRYFGRFAGMS